MGAGRVLSLPLRPPGHCWGTNGKGVQGAPQGQGGPWRTSRAPGTNGQGSAVHVPPTGPFQGHCGTGLCRALASPGSALRHCPPGFFRRSGRMGGGRQPEEAVGVWRAQPAYHHLPGLLALPRPPSPKWSGETGGCGRSVHTGPCPLSLPRHWSCSDGARMFAIRPGSAAASTADGWGGGGRGGPVGVAGPQCRSLRAGAGALGKAPGEPLPRAAAARSPASPSGLLPPAH